MHLEWEQLNSHYNSFAQLYYIYNLNPAIESLHIQIPNPNKQKKRKKNIKRYRFVDSPVMLCWSTSKSVNTWGHSASRAKQNSLNASKPLALITSMSKSMSDSRSCDSSPFLWIASLSISAITPCLTNTPSKLVTFNSRDRAVLCLDNKILTSAEPAMLSPIVTRAASLLTSLTSITSLTRRERPEQQVSLARARFSGSNFYTEYRTLPPPERRTHAPPRLHLADKLRNYNQTTSNI